MDTRKPMITGVPVGSKKDGVSWADFKYEKLPQLCYIVANWGMTKNSAKNPGMVLMEQSMREKFGPWLRASSFGRKVSAKPHDQKGIRVNPKHVRRLKSSPVTSRN
ncbi:hypothetical protein SESBI_42705 [Sesbania bispinosa]|nr:hypothetical protein SESBI_42705 [Sesbania bispinosa]